MACLQKEPPLQAVRALRNGSWAAPLPHGRGSAREPAGRSFGRWIFSCLALAAVLAFASVAAAGTIDVPNPSFEKGKDGPEGWTLSGGEGTWLQGNAARGSRAIAVTGDGRDSFAWYSAPLPLKPRTVYRLRFQARNAGGHGGTPVSGPGFCNRDLGSLPGRWKRYASVFVTPRTLERERARLRFGQWHVKGAVAFDDVRLTEAAPVYARQGSLVLGEGERLRGNAYRFLAPFQTPSANHARPLVFHQCDFNTNRWLFGPGNEVVYRHEIAGRRFLSATVRLGLVWYREGEVLVSVSADGASWTKIGALGRLASETFAVPGAILGGPALWVRLHTPKDEGTRVSLQVGGFEVNAELDGDPARLTGRTRFFSLLTEDSRVPVRIEGLGTGLPGAGNRVTARLTNATGRALEVEASVTVSGPGLVPHTVTSEHDVPPGRGRIEIPYEVPGTGRLDLRLRLSGGIRFEGQTEFNVAELFRTDFGERLPGSSETLAVWGASSGWKVSRTRPPPDALADALVVRAARNETECAQLVLRPSKGLRGLQAACGDLRGPAGRTIPAGRVEILRVGYVEVTRPTDSTGVVAPWPDPLPPLRGAIDLEADRNQPLWVRVNVPEDAEPGTYRGTIRLEAEGLEASVPLTVEVFGFRLPDRMTCTTAFGFSPGNVWRYQKIVDPAQRRSVLEKYWADFSAHHVSPYDPAPLDPIEVSWPASSWEGGQRDDSVKHAGQSSLRVDDRSPTSQASARYARRIRIPAEGFLLQLTYRTKRADHAFIVTLNHHDASGAWMSGRNRDMVVHGDGTWQTFRRKIVSFPEGATSVRLTLWATVWKEDGSPTGTVWYDDVSLKDAGTGAELLRGGDFEPLTPSEMKPVFSWKRWDRAMARAIDHHHFNAFRLRIPGLGGGSFHSRREPRLLGYPESAPEYKAAFRNYARALEAHLEEKGWLDEAFVYWFDEPSPKDYAFVMNGFRKLKAEAPGLRRMLTEQVEEALVGGPNVWCPVSHAYDHAKAEARRREGDRFWWYVCTGPKAPYCTLFIDHPATELRVWLWQTWKRKIEGVLVWQTNYWTSRAAYPDRRRPQNPYEDPMGWVSGYSTPRGVKRPWGNGDGRFLYPPEAAASGTQAETVLEGPVDSIRWEMLRDGLEDYEYLAILKRLLEAKRASMTAGEVWEVEALLAVPETISSGMTTFTRDPRPIEKRRLDVARAIERLAKAR